MFNNSSSFQFSVPKSASRAKQRNGAGMFVLPLFEMPARSDLTMRRFLRYAKADIQN